MASRLAAPTDPLPSDSFPRSAPSAPSAAPASLAILLLAAVALAACAGSGPSPTSGTAAPFERATFLTVASFDGHPVPISIYRPDTADPVPVVLHVHGWGGSRETRLQAFLDFTDAGLAVVSIDMRGHGEARATSEARVASPTYEVRDVTAVLDFLAQQDWVRTDAPGDPLAGAMGGSYGGAFPLLASALDGRLDALVAQDTWNDLPRALAPNGVPKTAWLASLWLSASIQGRIHPDVRFGFEMAVRNGTMPAALASALEASSPSHYAGQAKAPVLLLQGADDTLFDLGEALRNFAQAGGEAALVAHRGGHSLLAPTRDEGTAQTDRAPCGDPNGLALAWFRHHLLGDGTDVPSACLTLDDGTALRSARLPEPEMQARTAAPLQIEVGNLTAHDSAPMLTAGGDVAVFGVPRLRGTLAAGAASGVVFWSLEVVDAAGRVRVANGQAMPQRVAASDAPQPFAFDLAPVAVHLHAGDTLRLAVAGRHAAFGAAPAPTGPAGFTDLRVALPTVPYST